MLYRKNRESELKKELFQNPTNEYRGAPFWAWNCKVTKSDVDYILKDLKRMGMGGAHIHCRTGMDLPYLSDEYMEMVRYAIDQGKALGLKIWLYDEDRFPSGSAGGKVTVDEKYRQRYLLLSPIRLKETDRRLYLGKYSVTLENGYLKSYCYIKNGDRISDDADLWYLYREVAGDHPWFNNQAYVDTLNPEAVRRFIELTHESYFKYFGDDFGKDVPAIFTDEPQFCPKAILGAAYEKREIRLPFTDDFAVTYKQTYGCDFLESLPECIWELPEGKISTKRYWYHDHLCERFTQAFADQIGQWCQNHGICLTGHMMEEPTLASQTAVLGEAMRSYRSFDIPGIDMLYDGRELNTAKQAQSAVHQYGCEGMLSELYGVTNWDFDFRGHKLAGDWQAALGVTVRVHHLTWTSMAGEAKRDYPASIGYQSPWYEEYSNIENYFARLNTALTRGKPVVRVGVIHPIESYWLYWGPRQQTQGIREEMDENFKKLTQWLLFGLIDFDFICEALWKSQMPDECLEAGESVVVGKMNYDVILVPNCVTLRRSTICRLKAFKAKGGRVIFSGTRPSCIDAQEDREAELFAAECENVGFSRNQILTALEAHRIVDVCDQTGARVKNMLSQVRRDGSRLWLFLAHCYKMKNPDLPDACQITIKISGKYRPRLYDAMSGDIQDIAYTYKDGRTWIEKKVFDHDSVLLCLDPDGDEGIEKHQMLKETRTEVEKTLTELPIPAFVDMELAEPNVLVLDMAEGRFDDGPWLPKEEILRLDNKFRTFAGYPLRTEAFAQPWVTKGAEGAAHWICLKYTICSETEVPDLRLAMENAQHTRIFWNGVQISPVVTGYYVDRSIQTVCVPGLLKGENTLIVKMPYSNRVNVEAMYLLGNFGVRVWGKNTVVERARKQIAFGDWCVQGLPFYGGNLTYKIPFELAEDGDIQVRATQFRCALVKVRVDGKDWGMIAFSPYNLTVHGLSKGSHMLELVAFGNRVNTFGMLHNCNHTEPWPGHPDSFRTKDAAWAYEYQLKPSGILISPVLYYQK